MRFSLAQPVGENAQQRHWRALAWMPLPWTIAGKEVRVMTLADYSTLSLIRSPIICGGDYSPEEVAKFLWFLSPEFSEDTDLRDVFLLEVRDSLRRCRSEVEEYLDFIFLDEPARAGKRDSAPTSASYVGSFVHCLAQAYGWSAEQILALPIPQAFQLVRRIQCSNGAPEFRDHDQIWDAYLCYLNTLPIDEREDVMRRVEAGESIEIPD